MMRYLREKFVQGKDDVLEVWAHDMNRTLDDYTSKTYDYKATDYNY